MNILTGIFDELEFVEDARYDISKTFDHTKKYDVVYLESMINKNVRYSRFIPEQFRDNITIMLYFIKSCSPACFTYASERLQRNFTFVCKAIHIDFRSIEYVPAEHQNNMDSMILIMDTLKSSCIFYWLYPIYYENREFVLNAIKYNGFQDTVASYNKHFYYRDDYEVMSKMILFDPSMKKYASTILLHDDEFLSASCLKSNREHKKRKITNT